jgi:hypothetical protein
MLVFKQLLTFFKVCFSIEDKNASSEISTFELFESSSKIPKHHKENDLPKMLFFLDDYLVGAWT